MSYTVKQLAKLAGITVRTLHHYDAIGLLKPQVNPSNRYRLYGDEDVAYLQQILFFRELEFSLEEIKRIMEAPEYDSRQALQEQKKLLELRKERLERLLETIEQTMQTKGGDHMSNDDKFSAFNDQTYQKHKDEAKARWGSTEAFKQSMERIGKLSKEEFARIREEGEDIARKTASLMENGAAFDSPKIQEQIGRFYDHLKNFYEPSYEMFRGLGQMYVDDPRFRNVYEQRAKGFAVFMRDAMKHYAEDKMANG